jgi:hypothetical protein
MLAGWRVHFCKEWPLGIAGDVLHAVAQPERIASAGGTPLSGIPGDGHLLRLYPERWQPIADKFLAMLGQQKP